MDTIDPLIERVSRRAEGLANLTCESAEDLQVSYRLYIHTVKNVRISTDILWRVVHISTEPVHNTLHLFLG